MLKKILLGLLILFVVLLLGLLLLPRIIPEDRAKAMLGEQVRTATGRELEITGELRWRVLPRISLQAGGITLSNPEGFRGEPLLEAGSLSASVAILPLIGRRLEIGDVTIGDATLRVLTDASGRSNLDGLAGGESTGAGDPPELSTGTIVLDNAELVMADARMDTRQVYRLDRFRLEPFRFNRAVDFSFAGRIGDPPVLADLEADGSVEVPAGNGPIRLTGLEISGRAAGADLPVGLSGDLLLQPGPPALLRLDDGRLSLGQDAASLSFEYRQGTPARVSAELRAERLDLDRILASIDTGETAAGSGDEAGGTASADHPLAFLREMDLNINLAVDAMTASGLEIRSLRAGARSRGGVLVMDPVRGDVAGGTFSAVVEVDARPAVPGIRVRPVFEVPALGEALAAWGLADHLTGGGRLELDLVASGLAPATFLSGLSGSGSARLSEGSIRGLDLEKLAAGVRERDPSRVAAAVGGETAYKSLNTSLQVGEGRLRLPDLQLETGDVRLGGQLSVGLGGLGLDGTLRFRGGDLQRLPIAISGTLTEPEFSLDVEGAAREEIGRRLLDALESGDDDDQDGPEAGEGDDDAGDGGA